MKNKDTKHNNIKLPWLWNIFAIILYIIFPVVLIKGIICIFSIPMEENISPVAELIVKLMGASVLIVLLCFLCVNFFATIMGTLKAKLAISRDNRNINKNNPYIYYRELPNNFGIGVTSLLFDSKIENYKDIIAVILDLCAKKYLFLNKVGDKYCIKILKNDDQQLLNNERYILDLIKSGNIKNIDYKKWYDYCLQDGTNLGLYSCNNESYNFKTNKYNTNRIMDVLVILHRVLSFGIALFLAVRNFVNDGILINSLLWFLITFLISFMGLGVLLFVPFYVVSFIVAMFTTGSRQTNISYAALKNNHLTRTKKGVDELYKLISFKNFLADFGNFVDKNPEEVVLWDSYLSYAQVFGLTKQIMNSGYKKLIDNSSFHIDDIDNITIYNVDLDN